MVTLSICGIFKEVITITAAALIFHDPLTPVNISGLMVTIVSIAYYNYIKISKMRAEALEETHHQHHPDCHVDHHISESGYAAVAADSDDEGHVRRRSGSLLQGEGAAAGSRSRRATLTRTSESVEQIVAVGESALSPKGAGPAS